MDLFDKVKKSNTLRNFFFGLATIAVVTLTVLNVYSLYQLRNTSIESAADVKKIQLEDFTNQVQYHFYGSVWDLRKLDISSVESAWNDNQTIPPKLVDILDKASNDPLYTGIYFIYKENDGCVDPEESVFRYDTDSKGFIKASSVPKIVCDGFSMSKPRARVIEDDYRFNVKLTFDSHRTMNIALVDRSDNSVIGHLSLVIDSDYLLHDYIAKELQKTFGNADSTGIVVWLRDWTHKKILLSSDDSYSYNREKYPIDLRQRFSDSLDDWSLHATILENPTIAASDASFTRNLIVLGVAVVAILGALLFIFINAQRERDLAQRQAAFLANITHELKTPLALMQAAGENIADGRVTDGNRLKNYGDHIYKESVRLKKMIEKLLDAAKVDSGLASSDQAPHFLQDLVTEFYEANREYIENQGFDITLSCEKDLPMIMVDNDHVETILNNLVENAMKYSKERKVIDIAVKKSRNYVELHVTDEGAGIPKNSIQYIFDKFYRVEDSLTAKTKGHGLGLSIVKNMVELNGASIEVDSQHGKGSSFIVKFPKLMKSGYDKPKHTTPSKNNRLTEENIDTYVQ